MNSAFLKKEETVKSTFCNKEKAPNLIPNHLEVIDTSKP